MPDRFYAPVPFDSSLIELSHDESQHLASVLRKAPGDVVEIFDGRGHAVEAVVENAAKRAATVRILRSIPATHAVSPRIELATAVPKGDRARWLIEKATELGADVWTPLALTRSVVDPGDGKLDKLRQTVITACKQCGRNDLLEIGATRAWTEWLAEASRRGPVLVAHPGGAPGSQIGTFLREGDAPREGEAPAEPRGNPTKLHQAAQPQDRQPVRPPGFSFASIGHIAIAIGPEGGFTDEEIAAATSAGARLLSLGPHILRIETAAIAALASLRLGTSD